MALYQNKTKINRSYPSLNISATGLAAYSNCARKFEWARVERWEYDGPKQANNMCLGSLTHYLLEEGMPYLIDPKGGPGNASYNCDNNVDSWIAAYTDNGIVQTDIYVKLLPYAKRMAINTFDWFADTNFFDKYKFVAAEISHEIDLGQELKLHCTADLIVQSKVTGNYGVIDYKTGSDLSTALMVSDWQMNAMALIMDEHYGPVDFAGHLRIKRLKTKAKLPYVQLNEMRFSEKTIQEARKNITALMSTILSDRIQLPNPTWNCASMCSFFDACEAKSSLQDWEYVMKVDHKKGN